MPNERKQQSLDIQITGSVDSSLARAIGISEVELAKLKGAVATLNAGFGKQAFGGMGDAAEKGFQEAQRHADNFTNQFKASFAGVFAAETLHTFFDEAMNLAGEFVNKMKEASNVAAGMEVLRAQFAAENQLSPEQIAAWQKYVEERSTAIPITMQAQYAGAKYISESVLEQDPEKKMELIKHEAALVQDLAALSVSLHGGGGESPVAALNEQYTSLALLISNMQKYGVTLENTLKPLEAAGLNIRPQLLLNKGIITQEEYAHWSSMSAEKRDEFLGDLAKDIHKRKLMESAVMDALEEADQPGGKAFGAAAALSKTTAGRESSFADVQLILTSKVGDIINAVVNPLLEKINTGFTGALPKVDAFFQGLNDKLSPIFNKELQSFFDTLSKQDWSKVIASGEKALDSFKKVIDKAQPFLDWLATDIPKEINSMLQLADSIEQVAGAIERAFNWTLKAFSSAPATPQEQAAVKAKAAAGGHVDEPPKRTNYLNDADFQKAMDIFNARPHAAAGGIVTRATALIAGEAGPEAILPLTMLKDHPLVRVTEESIKIQQAETEQTAKSAEEMAKLTQVLTQLSTVIAAMPIMPAGAFGMGSGATGGGGGSSGGGGGGGSYNSAVWDPILTGIAGKYNVNPKLLTSIARAEGVAAGDFNPLGLSPHGGGPTHYGSVEAGQAGMDAYVAAHLPHFLEATRTGDLDKFARWYSPPGAPNDPYKTNAQESGNIRHFMAEGGIVSRATHALIGEAGPEAVIPLSKAGGIGHTFNIHITGTDLGSNLQHYGEQIVAVIERALSSRFAAQAAV